MGTIAIANDSVGIYPEAAVLPTYFSNVDNRVIAECAGGSGNRFVSSGRSGLATGPSSRIAMPRLWTDIPTSRKQTLQPSANIALSETPMNFSEALWLASQYQWNR